MNVIDDPTQYPMPPSVLKGKVRIERDAKFLNDIANTTGVREKINLGQEGDIDLSPVMCRIIPLATDHGFIIFDKKAANNYEFHTAFLPDHRGKHAYMAARAAAKFMFLATDAVELHTMAPHDNPDAVPPRTFGFREWFENANGRYYRLHIMDWARRAPNLSSWGSWFHECLEMEKRKRGATIPPHDDDAANDVYAGLAAGMVSHGQPVKAVHCYNYWAATAGYHPAQLVSLAPTVIDTGDALVKYEGGNMEFLECR